MGLLRTGTREMTREAKISPKVRARCWRPGRSLGVVFREQRCTAMREHWWLPDLPLRLAPTPGWHLSHRTVNPTFASHKLLFPASYQAPAGCLHKLSPRVWSSRQGRFNWKQPLLKDTLQSIALIQECARNSSVSKTTRIRTFIWNPLVLKCWQQVNHIIWAKALW